MNPAVEILIRVFPAVAICPGGLFRQKMQTIEMQLVVGAPKDMLAKVVSIAQSVFHKSGNRGSACRAHFHENTGLLRVSE